MITLFLHATSCLFQNKVEDDKLLSHFRTASEETKHYLAEMT